jgi:hypothetical protein
MLNPLVVLPPIILVAYFLGMVLFNSGAYNNLSREAVPLTKRLSDVFPKLLPWNSLFRFKVRPDIVFPYMNLDNDFVYFPERMLLYNNAWNLSLLSRAVGEALQVRSSLWRFYYKVRPVLRWVFLAGFITALITASTQGLYFFAVFAMILDYISYNLSTDALNRARLVLVKYSPEVAEKVRLLPPSFLFESLAEPYRMLRYIVFHLRWRNL